MSTPIYFISSNAPPACYWDALHRPDVTIQVDASGTMVTNQYSEGFHHMSYGQQREYRESQQLFRRIYANNSNAYYTAKSAVPPLIPRYYTYNSYKEMQSYRVGVALVRQAYPEYFSDISGIPMKYGPIPFPI